MQIGPLDLPDEVLTALEEGRLVIFAGAGVSILPPACLPSFRGLVESIVGEQRPKDDQDPMDRVLGRAADEGIPVHSIAAKRLSQPDSRFNSLHESLVALFGSRAAVRIVTTNFDQHFEAAIEAQLGLLSGVEIYKAPALPVGSSFSGLVHLHGVLGGAPEELVLTDADFGRAYLTEGWAGRFVLELFREYSVLFVGYSYGDTVMSYLTRGLAPTFGRKRFAVDQTGSRKKWSLLGIEPIEYDPADDHRALREGLSQWVSLQRRGFLDWSQRLPALVGREPRALAPDEQGELEFCLKNPRRAKLFYRHAKEPGWLKWAEEHGRLQPLFSLEGDQRQLWDLATWFTDDPLGERGKVALQIALGSTRPVGGALAIVACQQVHGALAGRTAEPATATAVERLAAWATLVIERSVPGTRVTQMALWLKHLPVEDHPQLAVQVLAHLLSCRPAFRVIDSFWAREAELGLSIETPTEAEDLSYHWEELRPHIGALAKPLLSVVAEIFEKRWRWLVGLDGAVPVNDPWGWRRPWIERPSGAGESHALDRREAGPLLDIAKDVIDELNSQAPELAAGVIEQWLAASSPQLVQLGLYGLAKSSWWKPASKLEKLIAHHLPARAPFKVEAFRVLQESYPSLTPRQRAPFLKRAERLYVYTRGSRSLTDEEFDRRHQTAMDEWFNVLVWLERAAPGDPLLNQAVTRVRNCYPDFQPRDHPELDVVHLEAEDRLRPESHRSSAEIAGLSLPQWLAELDTAGERQRQEQGFTTDHVGGFLKETARAASERLNWGVAFARELVESGDFEHMVWREILTVWRERTFTAGEWRELVQLLDDVRLVAAQIDGITDVLRGLAKQQKPKATATMLRSGLGLAEKALAQAEGLPLRILSGSSGWLEQAVNHPGGVLAEYLIRTIGELAGSRPERNCGLPKACRRLLDAMMSGSGAASAMARVVLSTHAHYFQWLDSNWTATNLLPLFDWERDPDQAVQAWHGFLGWGRPVATLLDALSPAAVQLASHLEDLGGAREHYGAFVARAALARPDDPLTKEWFQAFLQAASDEDRAGFAWAMDHLLEGLRPEQQAEVWRSWLQRYLEHRANYPLIPEGKEFSALVGWAFRLPQQLGQLVECIEALPGRGGADDRLLWKLEQGELEGSDPNLLARLVLATLKRVEELEPWELAPFRGVITRLKKEGASEPLARELVEKYLEHGGQDHEELLPGRR